VSNSQIDRHIYCTQEDLLLGLRRAFAAGQESPYELMPQEVDRIFAALLERVKQRVNVEKLRKYERSAEKSTRTTLYGEVAHSPLSDNCPNCRQSSGLMETRFKMKDGDIYSGLSCLRCGWAGSLMELRSNEEVCKRPFDDEGLL